MRNRGLLMEPTFHKGDALIVDRARTSFDGRIVLMMYHEKFFVRRIYTADDSITLKADNPAFVDILAQPDDVWGIMSYGAHKDSAPSRSCHAASEAFSPKSDSGPSSCR